MKHSLRTTLVPLAAALALALVAAPLLAAGPAAPAGPGVQAPPQPPRGPLAGYLGCLRVVDLTETQKADVKAVLDAARPGLDLLHETLKTDREAFHAAITAASPDPCAVGAAALKVEGDMKAIGEELGKVRAAIEALLTPEQKAKLEGCLKAPKPNDAGDGGEEI